MTNIFDIGYMIVDKTPNSLVGPIHVILLSELIDKVGGTFDYETELPAEFMNRIKNTITGLDKIRPSSLGWYTTQQEEFPVFEIVNNALKCNHTTVIIEHLPPPGLNQ